MPHQWLKETGGRICSQCGLAQATGRFVDNERHCPKDEPYPPLEPPASLAAKRRRKPRRPA